MMNEIIIFFAAQYWYRNKYAAEAPRRRDANVKPVFVCSRLKVSDVSQICVRLEPTGHHWLDLKLINISQPSWEEHFGLCCLQRQQIRLEANLRVLCAFELHLILHLF